MATVTLKDDGGAEQTFDSQDALSIIDTASVQTSGFCGYWPTTKLGLQTLKTLLKGGAAAFWGKVIDFVIGLGDKACPQG